MRSSEVEVECDYKTPSSWSIFSSFKYARVSTPPKTILPFLLVRLIEYNHSLFVQPIREKLLRQALSLKQALPLPQATLSFLTVLFKPKSVHFARTRTAVNDVFGSNKGLGPTRIATFLDLYCTLLEAVSKNIHPIPLTLCLRWKYVHVT